MSQEYVELQVLHQGAVSFTRPVGARATIAGRAPTSDLLLTDAQVSWQHAMIWTDEQGTWIKDLGSSNGTFVNDARVTAPTQLKDGDRIRLGQGQELAIATRTRLADVRAFALEDLATGVRVPIRSERFVIGPDRRADLHIPHPDAVTLLLHAKGEIWLGRGADDQPLDLGAVFEVGPQRFRVVEVDATRAPTLTVSAELYPYNLSATLDGPTGPSAVLVATTTQLRHEVSAGNRATLLYLLGRQLCRDREEGRSAEDAGWCADSDVSIGIWGRGRGADPGAALHVLIHRTRQELGDAGFDPWFIEKRRRYVRARLHEVELG